MHRDHEVFLAGIDNRHLVTLTFESKDDDGQHLIRSCAPMDFGPSRRAKDPSERYHFWDFDSDSAEGPHTLSLLLEQITAIEPSKESFDPGEFITWDTNWFYERDWGQFS